MYSSNFPKISQHTRSQIYKFYLQKEPVLNKKGKILKHRKIYTQAKLATLFGVSRQTVSEIIHRGRNNDFTVHKPINHLYLTEEYIKKRKEKLELKLAQKAERKAKREEIAKTRYEHKKPGDLGHMDLKLLPPILGEKVIKGQKEYLLTLVDDCTRIAYFTIIQGKNQHQTKAGLERIFARCPISFGSRLDNKTKLY